MAGYTERGEWDELAGTGVVTHQIQSRVKASIRLCAHNGFQGVCFGGLLCCVRLPCVPTTYADFSHEMWDQYSLIKTACNYFRNTWKGQAKMGKDMLSFRPTLHPSTINTQGCCLKYNNHHNGSDGKESAYSVGGLGLIPGLRRPPGGGHSNPLQYSCLEKPRGSRSLAGCSPWGRKASDTAERLSTQQKHVHPARVQRLGIPACWSSAD